MVAYSRATLDDFEQDVNYALHAMTGQWFEPSHAPQWARLEMQQAHMIGMRALDCARRIQDMLTFEGWTHALG